ncbi:MAG TPA: hypothetical protein VN372_07485 [Methanospirillum sp.]|nr:hypothetical protein [Methanospirillum sp.]
MKTKILEEIGEYNLLLPYLVQKALTAGDKSQYYLNIIKAAIDNAENPDIKRDPLSDLRERVDIKNQKFDSVISETRISPEGMYHIPFFDEIIARLSAAILDLVNPFSSETYYSNPPLLERAQLLLDTFTGPEFPLYRNDERINLLHEEYPGENFISLIREVEEILIPLQEKMAPEDVYGSTAYMIEPEDMYLIRSFMIGLNRTESLRFDHPGLGTQVIRVGDSLIIENEVGMTDAHVLVLLINGLNVTIRYTDVHLSRVSFFQSVMGPYPVLWKEIISRNYLKGEPGELYHIATGTFSARSGEELLMFISALSSKIVFLIEWNRARKAFKYFLSGNDVLKVLHKAVKREVGHRAFLILGGERLIFEALEDSSHVSLKYGETLSDILGHDSAIEFCISVLEIASQYLRQDLPISHIREDIKAELTRQFLNGRDDLEHSYVAYAGKIKKMVSYFTVLSTGLSDSDLILKNDIEVQIQECAVQMDKELKIIRSRISHNPSEGSWICCFIAVNNAMVHLSEVGYLYTLLPGHDIGPDSAREINRLSGYAECAADILYQAIEGGGKTLPRDTSYHNASHQNSGIISELIISSTGIFRSAQKRMYLSGAPGSDDFIFFEICRLFRETIQYLLSAAAYVRDEHWYYQLRPHLRFSFKDNLTQTGQRT